MAKLVAKDGKIMAEHKFEAVPITVRFRRAAISPKGDLGAVEICHEDGNRVEITFSQAVSLANEILRRCQ